jgi:ribonuclease HII
VIIGVDEVGRGCLAGPVVAAAVLASREDLAALAREVILRDSKKMTAKQRARSAAILRERVRYGVGVVCVQEIDRVNILQATFAAMREAVAALGETQGVLHLIDGNQRVPGVSWEQRTIIGGDDQELVIAAASIIAKEYRDALMVELATQYPGYAWEVNKGYGTAAHLAAIRELGLTPEHRKLFCRKLVF